MLRVCVRVCPCVRACVSMCGRVCVCSYFFDQAPAPRLFSRLLTIAIFASLVLSHLFCHRFLLVHSKHKWVRTSACVLEWPHGLSASCQASLALALCGLRILSSPAPFSPLALRFPASFVRVRALMQLTPAF